MISDLSIEPKLNNNEQINLDKGVS